MAKPTLIKRNTDQTAMQRALQDNHQPAPAPSQASGASDASSFGDDAFRVGSVYEVALALLAKSDNNARIFYNVDELDLMSTSLREKGQDVPAIGYVKSGRVVLVDGQKRFQAATSAGLATLKVLITKVPQDACAEYEESRRINLDRSSQTVLDDALRLQAMLDSGDYKNNDDIATRLKIPDTTVSKILGLKRIPDRLLRMMSHNPRTTQISIAYPISLIFKENGFAGTPEKAEAIAQEVIEQTVKRELGKDQVQALINSLIEGPKTRSRAQALPVKFGEHKGVLKVFPSRGQLDLSFRGLAPEKVEELQQRIEQMLAGQLAI